MNTIGMEKLVAVLALCGMAASGCATYGVTIDSCKASQAATSMKQFLVLAPNAPDAQAAQNKIYEWELSAK